MTAPQYKKLCFISASILFSLLVFTSKSRDMSWTCDPSFPRYPLMGFSDSRNTAESELLDADMSLLTGDMAIAITATAQTTLNS